MHGHRGWILCKVVNPGARFFEEQEKAEHRVAKNEQSPINRVLVSTLQRLDGKEE